MLFVSLNYIRLFAVLFMHCALAYNVYRWTMVAAQENFDCRKVMFLNEIVILEQNEWKRTHFVYSADI